MADAKTEDETKKSLFKEWSESTADLYERLTYIRLEWPTLTGQWCLDDSEAGRALISTFTLRQEAEYMREVEVKSRVEYPKYVKAQWDVPGSSDVEADPEFESLALLFLGQCPQNPQIVAGLADTGKLFLYKRSETPNSVATLSGHKESGAGLAWEPRTGTSKSRLVSGSTDGQIILWEVDLENLSEPKKVGEFQCDTLINEITWTHTARIIVSLESGHVLVLNPHAPSADATTAQTLDIESKIKLSDSPVNSAAINPFSQHLLGAGDDEGNVSFYDLRLASKPDEGLVYSNQIHEQKVTHLRWSPHYDGVLATAGMDAIVNLLDIRKIGQTSAADDGILEVLFKHMGHIEGNQVMALDFHPTVPMHILSSDEKSKLMIWQIRKSLYTNEVGKIPVFA